ncbi:hypothetical protein Hanom_Chr13g01198211 [Helianthus anomalus]
MRNPSLLHKFSANTYQAHIKKSCFMALSLPLAAPATVVSSGCSLADNPSLLRQRRP